MTTQEKSDYEHYMKECLNLALIARSRGDSPVGSIIVLNGKIISRGVEGGKSHKDITFHAEIEAIRQAVEFLNRTDLHDCILVTTHEPCIMCSYVIRHHSIPLIIVGIKVPEIGGYSSGYPILTDAKIKIWTSPPKVITGILEMQCRKLKNGF
ncbi:MAG: nucleoside deaminase [Ginsengibacter sp.]